MFRAAWNDRIGETVTMGRESRTLVKVILNNEQRPIILWEGGNRSCGACVPALWEKWKENKEDRHARK